MRLDLPLSEIFYYEDFLAKEEADCYFERLKNEIVWEEKEITLFGKTYKMPRLTAWYGDAEAVYSYSGLTFYPKPWNGVLLSLREKVEGFVGSSFNCVLLNLYRDGKDSMGWHSDDERELGENPLIASVSFGGERRFLLRPKDKRNPKRGEIVLRHGSLLIMGGETQKHWLHGIPKTSKPVTARINLTFRYIRG
ncbi:MAG: alpha-ketoglutarate-dependent dioxygenase AlkB [Geminocystis sp.]|nr:alpha-ketoglutarate-dependent dioxygenase AlkB [Geminocystis sp.]HIK36669.1 alpha-ketoglutarate-dependent dioxygenase AlkB [Geminocystis sp. M7585_C2015_104]MCS7148473.1 alpha-ketoglutarate-dependent dioxygenase AlkB [Geminocystis sp.]MCX8079429.1 alpha-ketoglutarate-dependent dioxygenase AlkB [Geminocystis sp.]MDW8114953.1 alpha-ketoglutarate-dependent dioxygenase AlkB [Geminocystis sp.]